MSIEFDIVKELIKRKKFKPITEYAHIIHDDKCELFVCEYPGTSIRVGKDVKGNIQVLCPKNITPVQEGHVAQAIANGSIFDDASEIDNNAEMIERTSIPHDAMINSGKRPPKHLKSMITLVIGKMDDDGCFEIGDTERNNGVNFIKDLVKAHETNQNMNNVFDNYLEKDHNEYNGTELGKEIIEICKEIDEICNTNPDDCITDDDCCDLFDDIDMDSVEIGPDDYNINDESDDNELDSKDCEECSEDECKEECCEEYYTDNNCDEIYQEGVFKTLKRLGYDHKTKTILTDIPDKFGKNGDKMRCSVKFGDHLASEYGTCLECRDNGDHIIHVSLADLLANTGETIETIKHEEGHLYVSINKDKFKKDFEKSIKLVNKYSDKLGDHGNVPDEYVADLYAAKTSGYNGEKLIEYLKKYAIKNKKDCEKIKRKVDKGIKILKRIGHRLYMDKTPINDKEKELLEIALGRSYDEAYKQVSNEIIPQIFNVATQIATTYGGKKGEYASQFETSTFFEKPLKKLNVVKEILQSFKLLFSGIRKFTITAIPKKDFDKCIKILSTTNDNIDEFVKAIDFEVKARIHFIRKYVNENGDIDNTSIDTYDDVTSLNEYNSTDSTNVMNYYQSSDSKYSQEGFLSKKPKKLKPIPRDIIAYITCEMNDIHSANDQAMLSGYTCSKIELVDFYLTILDTQDARYIVPHDRPYLSMMKQELERLLTQILRIRPINRSEQIWRVNYPTI